MKFAIAFVLAALLSAFVPARGAFDVASHKHSIFLSADGVIASLDALKDIFGAKIKNTTDDLEKLSATNVIRIIRDARQQSLEAKAIAAAATNNLEDIEDANVMLQSARKSIESAQNILNAPTGRSGDKKKKLFASFKDRLEKFGERVENNVNHLKKSMSGDSDKMQKYGKTAEAMDEFKRTVEQFNEDDEIEEKMYNEDDNVAEGLVSGVTTSMDAAQGVADMTKHVPDAAIDLTAIRDVLASINGMIDSFSGGEYTDKAQQATKKMYRLTQIKGAVDAVAEVFNFLGNFVDVIGVKNENVKKFFLNTADFLKRSKDTLAEVFNEAIDVIYRAGVAIWNLGKKIFGRSVEELEFIPGTKRQAYYRYSLFQ